MSAAALRELVAIDLPIVQAPMAGVSTPAMAAVVSNAGALGSLGIGAMDVGAAARSLAEFRARSSRSVNVNVFCHSPARPDPARSASWIARLAPDLARFGAVPPTELREIYRSFIEDDGMLAMLLTEKPTVVSFHFGVPAHDRVRSLRDAGIVLFGSATSLAEARVLVAAGVHVVVAQGYEAGGHRGVFDPDAPDDRLGTFALTRLLSLSLDCPVVAAGGIMDGAGIVAALRLGAAAAQLGTAFVACDESAADAGFRTALASDAAHHTVMTRAISGRPARCLSNHFTRFGETVSENAMPSYPVAYDAGKALNAAAKAAGEAGYGAQWAGQGAPLARSMSTAALIETLAGEIALAEAGTLANLREDDRVADTHGATT